MAPSRTHTKTHIVVDTWAETSVINEPDKMPKAAHAGDRCALAEVDCDVTFKRDEVVWAPTRKTDGTRNSHADRHAWVCGLHVFSADSDRGGERRYVQPE